MWNNKRFLVLIQLLAERQLVLNPFQVGRGYVLNKYCGNKFQKYLTFLLCILLQQFLLPHSHLQAIPNQISNKWGNRSQFRSIEPCTMQENQLKQHRSGKCMTFLPHSGASQAVNQHRRPVDEWVRSSNRRSAGACDSSRWRALT